MPAIRIRKIHLIPGGPACANVPLKWCVCVRTCRPVISGKFLPPGCSAIQICRQKMSYKFLKCQHRKLRCCFCCCCCFCCFCIWPQMKWTFFMALLHLLMQTCHLLIVKFTLSCRDAAADIDEDFSRSISRQFICCQQLAHIYMHSKYCALLTFPII